MQREQISALREGALASAALLVGIVPWGIVAGVAMVSAGLTQGQAVAMSVLVFAGTAQLAVLPLLIAKAPLWVMVATALVVNLRYVIYSAVLALFAGRYRPDDGNRHKHWYFLGGSLVMWCAWQLSSGIGIFAGAMIPGEWSLEFASTLALIALLIPLLFDHAVAWGALAAGGVALIAARLPLNLGLLAAISVGVSVGLAVARLGPRNGEGRG